uniref:Dynein light chain Tctex-type 3 n=2 Tax=Bos taurus TaxID=9913 RepID=A0ABI0NM10_BOVIN
MDYCLERQKKKKQRHREILRNKNCSDRRFLGEREEVRNDLRRLGATMEEYHRPCDEVGFNADEAHNIVQECIDGVLGGEDYNQNNIDQWTANIVEQSLAHLVKLGKAHKYIVTCAVVQRSPYGFHTASSCFWDTTSDGTCTVRWENRTMNCIVNVFAIAIVL